MALGSGPIDFSQEHVTHVERVFGCIACKTQRRMHYRLIDSASPWIYFV